MNLPETLAIVLPCYNEEPVLDETTRQLTALLDSLAAKGLVDERSHILYVDDGSTDATWAIVSAWHEADERVCGISLAGNVGHQNALLAGLTVAKDTAGIIITIDADLQDDINAIEEMIERYREGFDIVYGVRNSRKSDSWLKRSTATAFYRFMRNSGAKAVYNHADFRLMSRRAVEQLCLYRERNLFLRGMVPLIGYRTTCVYYSRGERRAGQSKYPLGKMLNFAIDGITSFSVKPVRIIFYLGLAFLIISLAILIYVLYNYICGTTAPGWASLMLSVWFCSGCVLIGIGVTGEYIGKIYLEVKDRPRYNIEKTILPPGK